MGKPIFRGNFLYTFIELFLKTFVLFALLYPVASVNLTTIYIGGSNGSVSDCIPVSSNTSLYLSVVDPTCDTRVDIYVYHGHTLNPPLIKTLVQTYFSTNTFYVYKFTGSVDIIPPLLHYVVTCNITYSYQLTRSNSSSYVDVAVGTQRHTYVARHNSGIIIHTRNITASKPNDLSVKIHIINGTRNLTVHGSIKIELVYYDNIHYSAECGPLTIAMPKCQLHSISFKNQSCILAFSHSIAKLQFGDPLGFIQPYARSSTSKYASSIITTMSTVSMHPSSHPTPSNHPTDLYAGGTALGKISPLTIIVVFCTILLLLLLLLLPPIIIVFIEGDYITSICHKQKEKDLEYKDLWVNSESNKSNQLQNSIVHLKGSNN